MDDSHLLHIVFFMGNLAPEKSICRTQLQPKPTEMRRNDVALHWKPQGRTELHNSNAGPSMHDQDGTPRHFHPTSKKQSVIV